MRLYCEKGPLQGEALPLKTDAVIRLGREPLAEEHALSDVFILDSPNISKNHCDLFFDDSLGAWVIRDLESFNGIRVNKVKVKEAALKAGDRIDLAEFRFRLEETVSESQAEPTLHQIDHSQASRVATRDSNPEPLSFIGKLKGHWQALDFYKRALMIFAAAAFFIHFSVFQPVAKETERNVFRQSARLAEEKTKRLAQVNQSALSQEQFHFLDCQFLGTHEGVLNSFILNERGEVICPVSSSVTMGPSVREAVQMVRALNTCKGPSDEIASLCTVVEPIRSEPVERLGERIVGYAVLTYAPVEVEQVRIKFRDLWWQTLLITLITFALALYVAHRWMRQGLRSLTDDVHLLFTGTAQNVESPKSFAALQPLAQEVNRLFSKVNQGLSEAGGSEAPGAGFLQQFLEQVFLLEDRALLAVDEDNQVLAVSAYFPELIPLQEPVIGSHVTEAVADTHLQAELMTFLNELGNGQEILDKPLSSADRVFQAQGLPLWVNGQYVGSLVIF